MIIGLLGRAQSGKSSVARHLVQARQFKLVPFAGPLKSMLMELGLTEEQVYGATKEIPDPLLCGQTPRHAMRTLGTEWGRQLIGQDIWVNAWEHKARKYPHVVCDDVRFPNEVTRIKELGGLIIRIRRPAAETEDATHESEAHTLTLPVDHEIWNEEGQPAIAYSKTLEIITPYL